MKFKIIEMTGVFQAGTSGYSPEHAPVVGAGLNKKKKKKKMFMKKRVKPDLLSGGDKIAKKNNEQAI